MCTYMNFNLLIFIDFLYIAKQCLGFREKQRCTTGIRKCNKSAYLSHVLSTVKQFVGKSRIYRKKTLVHVNQKYILSNIL